MSANRMMRGCAFVAILTCMFGCAARSNEKDLPVGESKQVDAATSPTNIGKSSAIRSISPISSSELLVSTDNNLLLSQDGGKIWVDVLPQGVLPKAIAASHFTSNTRGWVATVGYSADKPIGTIYRTTDAGNSWQKATVVLPVEGAGRAQFDFLDDQRTGWLMIKRQTSPNFDAGWLFKTDNGGASWVELQIPVAGAFDFVNDKDGWAIGGPMGDKLFFTHDGGKSWSQASLETPSSYKGDGVFPLYHLPTFFEAGQGILPITFTGQNEAQPHGLAYYATSDSGHSWTLISTVDLPQGTPLGLRVPTSVTGPNSWISMLSNGLLTTEDKGKDVARRSVSGLTRVPNDVRFVGKSLGWAYLNEGQCTDAKTVCSIHGTLLKTENGGTTWTPVSIR